MMSLPGVGQKMSHICMKQAWNKITGIGVDTHVHKVTKRLGWVEDSKDPDFTRVQLESWMPRQFFKLDLFLLEKFGARFMNYLQDLVNKYAYQLIQNAQIA